MKNRQIVNIVNFIRAVEPRVKIDLFEPVAEQVRLKPDGHLIRPDSDLGRRETTFPQCLSGRKREFCSITEERAAR